LEGGPVPFMEALAMGKLAIAPSIGVIGEFPHIDYEVGNYESLKKAILTTKSQFSENGLGFPLLWKVLIGSHGPINILFYFRTSCQLIKQL